MMMLLRIAMSMVLLSAMAFGQVQAPKAVTSPDPVYPPEAAGMGLGGSVVVHVEVNKKGEVSVKNAFGPVAPCSNLDDKRSAQIREAVIEAAKNARFEPPYIDGKPANIDLSLTFRFDKMGKPVRGPNGGAEGSRVVEAGVLQGRIKHLARPEYPSSAKANRASGAVPVSVQVDTNGKVVAAAARGGHPLLRHAASVAACKSSIEPVVLSGVPIEVTGVLTYYFVP